ncbi:MAG: hypothetical protein WBW48_02590 [Anaerolineae bacterium]
MKDERYEASELSELIDRVVLEGAEAAAGEASFSEETIALVNDLQTIAQATPMREGFAHELEGRLETQPMVQRGNGGLWGHGSAGLRGGRATR